ncbi:aminoglycoside phosphotransferase family protein [Streptomyces sp. CA-288835]|uniref:aminoglycoside phosphotransferase family protein n=1 Tax=Streptomyces sp. CA-288835 TaxID=3240069 RepID=UPI003D8DFEDE
MPLPIPPEQSSLPLPSASEPVPLAGGASDGVPDLRLLTGPDAGELLAAALEPAGRQLLTWRVENVDHQPGDSCTAVYRVQVRGSDGRTDEERIGARAGRLPRGATVLEDGVNRVAVWRFPYDPWLPALPSACDSGALARLLEDVGCGGGPVRYRVRAYRPGRRAVVEVTGSYGRLFIKVVRPSRVDALHRRHRLLTEAGVPAPASLGFTPDGLVVLQALPGRTLREVLRGGGGGGRAPSAEAVLGLLDRLPPELASGAARPSWAAKAPHYAAVVGAAVPELAAQARELAEEVTVGVGSGPVVAVHGDLYESQLLVEGGRISGLLDVDTAGPGERVDDLGCLLGHLSVLAQIDRERADAINRLGAAYLTAFAGLVDPVELRRRTAAVVLSLATGPHRVQEAGWQAATRARLDLAMRWLHPG